MNQLMIPVRRRQTAGGSSRPNLGHTARVLLAVLATLALALTAIGCGKSDKDKGDKGTQPETTAPADPTATAPTPPQPEQPTAEEPAAEELPTAQDYEAEVNEEITAENLEKHLETLEKEMGVEDE